MSITDELREWFKDRFFMANGWQEIHDIADRIDAEHEKAVRENERLKVELDRVLGELEDAETGPVIGSATVEVTPRIDWSRMADELDVFTQLVRGFAEQVEEDE